MEKITFTEKQLKQAEKIFAGYGKANGDVMRYFAVGRKYLDEIIFDLTNALFKSIRNLKASLKGSDDDFDKNLFRKTFLETREILSKLGYIQCYGLVLQHKFEKSLGVGGYLEEELNYYQDFIELENTFSVESLKWGIVRTIEEEMLSEFCNLVQKKYSSATTGNLVNMLCLLAAMEKYRRIYITKEDLTEGENNKENDD